MGGEGKFHTKTTTKDAIILALYSGNQTENKTSEVFLLFKRTGTNWLGILNQK